MGKGHQKKVRKVTVTKKEKLTSHTKRDTLPRSNPPSSVRWRSLTQEIKVPYRQMWPGSSLLKMTLCEISLTHGNYNELWTSYRNEEGRPAAPSAKRSAAGSREPREKRVERT